MGNEKENLLSSWYVSFIDILSSDLCSPNIPTIDWLTHVNPCIMLLYYDINFLLWPKQQPGKKKGWVGWSPEGRISMNKKKNTHNILPIDFVQNLSVRGGVCNSSCMVQMM